MPNAFQPGAFQSGAFQMESSRGVSVTPERIPRWLLKFERTGKVTYLSDVGGDVEGQFYVPAVAEVSHSPLIIDLERMQIPSGDASVHISPSALREHFIEINELGQAKVLISSWDGRKARPIIKANMQNLGRGYDGEVTSFKLTEEFTHNENFPPAVVQVEDFPGGILVDGAKFRLYPVVWGNAPLVPGFALRTVDESTVVWMLADGARITALPVGPGVEGKFRDANGRSYIGSTITDGNSGTGSWTYKRAQGVRTAADLIRLLIAHYSEYEEQELDQKGLGLLYAHLQQFPAAGYSNSEGKLFGFISNRFQREYMFVLWQQAGLLTGAPIDPTAQPARSLLFGVQLLELRDQVFDELHYTSYKVRYNYRNKWLGLVARHRPNSPYLKALQERWGQHNFGEGIEVPYHAASVDLPDVYTKGAAVNIIDRYVSIFHRGEKVSYFQLAEFAEMPYGMMVSLTDPERGYDNKRAILIGRQWLTPEYIVQTYRTIEPMEFSERPRKTTTGTPSNNSLPFTTFASSCWQTPSEGSLEGTQDSLGNTVVAVAPSAAGSTITMACGCGFESASGFVDYVMQAKVDLKCITTPPGPAVPETVRLTFKCYLTLDYSDDPAVFDHDCSNGGSIEGPKYGCVRTIPVAVPNGTKRVVLEVSTIGPSIYVYNPDLRVAPSGTIFAEGRCKNPDDFGSSANGTCEL